jgi:hypothetical protein
MVLRLVLAIALLGSGCVFVPLHQFRLGTRNEQHIAQVRIGQTLAEVERVMGPPERRNARVRFDGISVEEWTYLTDAIRRTDTTITFVGGKVEEVRAVVEKEED